MSNAGPTPTLTTSDDLDTIPLTAALPPTGTSVSKADHYFLQPGITPLPTPCSEVVLQLSTALLVRFDAYYTATPIESFRPTYRSLGDGSLISPPFDEDLQSAYLSLLIIGSLAAVFFRNIFVSFNYLKRGKIKKKNLFYVLLASQLLAPISISPIIVSYFVKNVDCTIIVHTSYISAMISLALLITGILGIKAYKCLENPRILLVVLGLLQLAATVFVILDVIMTKGARRLTGSCVQIGNLRFTRYFVSIQFFQSLLICLCFVYACYKSRGSPASRGRMSVRLSLDDMPIQMPPKDEDSNSQSRGWWDYVPENQQEPPQQQGQRNPSPNDLQGKLRAVPSHLVRLLGTRNQRRRYRPYDPPYHEPKEQRTTIRVSDLLDITEEESTARIRRRRSPTLSVGSRFSRLIPRNLFRKVIKDELLYTTFITFTCVVVAILSVIGLNFRTSLSVSGWITLNWAVISLLTVHSFGRVVHRHEREAWIQQSASRSIRVATTYSAGYNSRRAQTRTPSLIPQLNRALAKQYRGGDPNDPYSETQPLDKERFSWQFGTIAPSPISLPRSPLLLSVRNVTLDKTVTQEFEFERAPLQRNVSWQSVLTTPSRI